MANVASEMVVNSPNNLTIDPKESTNSSNLAEALKNLSEDEMIRGTRPENVEKQCLELCQAYIGGSWLQTNDPSDVTVTRITGGLTNQLYKCSLNESVKRVKNAIYLDEPMEVAIKLYESKHMKNFKDGEDERLSDTISLTILGQTGLGPKIYGIFSGGVIQEFVDHDQFTLKYQKQPDKVQLLVEKLARFHHLKVPIRKNHNWVIEDLQNTLNEAFTKRNAQAIIDELKLEKLGNFDIRQEHQKLMTHLEALKSPLVFTHFDFRGSNILVRKSDGNILFVDAEYCAYSYRAYDIATILNEWGFEPFDISQHGMPTEEVMKHFVQMYIAECDKLVPGYSNKPGNSPESILKETKFFTMFRYLWFASMIMNRTESVIEAIPFDPKGNMKFCETLYGKYWSIKEQLIKDGTLKE